MSSNISQTTNSIPRHARESSIVSLDKYREMRQSGMSQESAAESIGVSRRTLRHWDERRQTINQPPEVVAFFESSAGFEFLKGVVLFVVH
ncbi:MAG: helix-turn-helix domain-containing protein [SAR324 cluster bacterium]|nr:helix-turn-helix domain-containing protein [SAR324 cluster bacterium]